MYKSILLLLVLAFSSFALADVNLEAGESFEFNFTNSNSENVSETFICGFPPISDFNISISSGETRFENSSYCSVTTSCASVEQEASICSVTRTLDPGEDYERVSGACDIEFFCEESTPEQVCNDIGNLTRRSTFKVFDEGNFVNIDFDGETVVSFKKNSTSILHESEVVYQCPSNTTPEDLTADDMVEFCQETFPLFGTLFQQTLDDDREGDKELTTCLNTLSSERSSLEGQLSGAEERVSVCKTELEATTNDLNDCRQELSNSQWKDWALFFSIGAALFFLVTTLFLLFLYFKGNSKGGEPVYG